MGVLPPLLISSFLISLSLCTYDCSSNSVPSLCLRITSHLCISYQTYTPPSSTPDKINSQNLSFCIRKGSVGPNFMPPGFKPRPLQEPKFICIQSLSYQFLSIWFYASILPQFLNLKIIPSLIFVYVLIHHCMNFHLFKFFFFICFLNFLVQEDIFVSMHKHNLSNYVEAARFLFSQVQSYHTQIHFYKYLIWITLSSIECLASNFKQHSN